MMLCYLGVGKDEKVYEVYVELFWLLYFLDVVEEDFEESEVFVYDDWDCVVDYGDEQDEEQSVKSCYSKIFLVDCYCDCNVGRGFVESFLWWVVWQFECVFCNL